MEIFFKYFREIKVEVETAVKAEEDFDLVRLILFNRVDEFSFDNGKNVLLLFVGEYVDTVKVFHGCFDLILFN